MMKLKIILGIFITSLWLLGKSQDTISLPIDTTTKLITYKGVEIDSGQSAKSLYAAGKEWLQKTFKDYKQVIKLEDENFNKIIGNGCFPIAIKDRFGSIQSAGFAYFTIILQFKDNKYRYEFTGFYCNENLSYSKDVPLETIKPSKNMSWYGFKNNWQFVKSQVDRDTKDLIESLKINMKKYKKSTDW